MESDWTLTTGLHRALLSLAVASCISMLWAVPFYFAVPAIDWVGNHLAGGLLAIAGSIVVLSTALWVVAFPVGALLSHRLNERLGVDGLLPLLLGVAFACIVSVGGYMVAIAFYPSPTWLTRLVLPAMALQTSVVVAWRTWVNPPD